MMILNPSRHCHSPCCTCKPNPFCTKFSRWSYLAPKPVGVGVEVEMEVRGGGGVVRGWGSGATLLHIIIAFPNLSYLINACAMLRSNGIESSFFILLFFST